MTYKKYAVTNEGRVVCTECESVRDCTVMSICFKTRVSFVTSQLRDPLVEFARLMETKLRKNDHKTSWRDQPIEALFRLLMLEVEEFRVADEFFNVAEARNELVDIANFALILHDRLGMIDQDKPRRKVTT